jgi:hypothetical protein
MGLINISVRVIPINIEKKISFRMLYQKCNTYISDGLFCEEWEWVPKSEIALRRGDGPTSVRIDCGHKSSVFESEI